MRKTNTDLVDMRYAIEKRQDGCVFTHSANDGGQSRATIRMTNRIASPRNVASDTAVASFKMFPCLMLMLPLPHRATYGT